MHAGRSEMPIDYRNTRPSPQGFKNVVTRSGKSHCTVPLTQALRIRAKRYIWNKKLDIKSNYTIRRQVTYWRTWRRFVRGGTMVHHKLYGLDPVETLILQQDRWKTLRFSKPMTTKSAKSSIKVYPGVLNHRYWPFIVSKVCRCSLSSTRPFICSNAA